MALNDRKITVYANPVANMPDHPSQTGYTAAQLKAAFDAIANEEVKVSINGIIDDVIATADGVSGADQIGATAITDLDGATVQSVLESLRNKLKSIVDSSSGADFIGATAISNLDGTTVQAILESLRNKIKSTVDGSSGADFIGATALKVGGATTVQGQLEEIQALETPREEAEVIRVSQEAVRVLTENSRVIAESSRANAETSRTNTESGRVTAENNRVTAEQTRVEADILRGQTVEAIEANYAPRLTTAEEQINTLDAEVDTHKTDAISEVVIVTRDLSLTGNQVVSGFSKVPKRLDIIASVGGTSKFSIGNKSSSGQFAMMNTTDVGTSGITTGSIALGANATNYVYGVVVINADKTITITWTNGGSGTTGTAAVRIVAHYHD